MPSAIVVPPGASVRRVPPSARPSTRSAPICTPTISMSGRVAFAATAIPAIRPPPPTGTTSTSRSGCAASISSATVPWPAIDRGVVVRGHERRARARAAMRRASAVASVEVVAVQHHVRAERLGAGDLGERRVARASRWSRRCRAAGRGGRRPARGCRPRPRPRRAAPASRVEPEQEVAGAPFLERRGVLEVLELHDDVGAGDLRQRPRGEHGVSMTAPRIRLGGRRHVRRGHAAVARVRIIPHAPRDPLASHAPHCVAGFARRYRAPFERSEGAEPRWVSTTAGS